MKDLLTALGFGAISALIAIKMCGVTNKKIAQWPAEECLGVLPYSRSSRTDLLFLAVVAVSALCGGLISRNAFSAMAVVKLAACYFAILAAAIIDYKLRIIPNWIPLTLVGICVLLFAVELIFAQGATQQIIASLVGCLLCGLFLALGNKLSKGGIGGGDIKLLAAVGLLCGAYMVFTVLLIALLCCCVYAAVGVLGRKMTLKNSVPFGPFIYLGYVIMCLLTV